MPQSGCKVRKSYKQELKLNAKLTRDTDSMRVIMRDSMQTLSMVRNTLAETITRMDKVTAERRAENISIEKKTVPNPVTIPGKTYKTTVPGNWMLDTSGIKDGKLIYFDLDNDDVRATAYYQAGQMRVELQTKDKVIDVPAEELRITKSTDATKNSSDKSAKDEKVITAESLKEVSQVVNSDSGQIKESENQTVDVDAGKQSNVSTGTSWVTISIIVLVVIIAAGLLWHFSVIGKVVVWVKRIINKIKSK
ncbi:MAG: hypothetical protein BGO31_00240 [Bacteroidetes bacterium 43-16]|nr:MAG: hypothetical protein BGO31_00240 [Bacteroidetes bacterium 43-16]